MTAIVGDITKLQGYDVIINPTNTDLKAPIFFSKSVDRAVRQEAGASLETELEKIGSCDKGEAIITDAYNLPCKRIIHTVGPEWSDDGTERVFLENCYNNVLTLAKKENLRKIAIPSISTGNHEYPFEQAAEIAVESVERFCKENPDAFEEITFVFLDSDKTIKDEYDKLLSRKDIKPLGYYSLSVELKSYDEKQARKLLLDLIDDKLNKKAALRLCLREIIGKLPDKSPEELLLFISHHELIRRTLISFINDHVLKKQSNDTKDLRIKDFSFRCEEENVLRLVVEIENLDFTELINKVCQSKDLKDGENKNLIFILSIVNRNISEEAKSKVLTGIVNDLQEEIGNILEETLNKKFNLKVEVGHIELLR